jgi:hypothetical protein
LEGLVNLESKQYGKIVHQLASNCSWSEVLENLIYKLSHANNSDWDNLLLEDILSRLARASGQDGIDVLFMTPSETRRREVNEKGIIKNLMQGKSVRISSDHVDYYKGDREIHSQRVQLQVHLITLHDKFGTIYPKLTVALALYIPDEIAVAVGRLIMSEK